METNSHWIFAMVSGIPDMKMIQTNVEKYKNGWIILTSNEINQIPKHFQNESEKFHVRGLNGGSKHEISSNSI